MSESIANLYAARIFAEHPLAFWSLDDEVSFLSRLSVSEKDLSNWSLYNMQESLSSSPAFGAPVTGNPSVLVTNVSASSFLSASAIASPINTINNLDPDKKTISINLFTYDFKGFVLSYDIGFKYNNTLYYKTISSPANQEWVKVSHTIDVPSGNIDLYPFFRINYINSGVNSGNDYDVAISGLSVGQWSELFHYKSTGENPTTIQDAELLSIVSASNYTSLSSSAITVIPADSYGIANSNAGYYLVENNRMLATSLDFPITFGSNNITSLTYPIFSSIPSLVFEGQGFLNK
jgi:hypothetical protein